MTEQPHSGFRFEDGVFLGLILVVTIAFGLVLEPFFGAILWALVLAILFGPMNKRLLSHMPGRENSAALLTLLFILVIVILPTILLSLLLIQELASAYEKIQSGHFSFAGLFERAVAALPGWLSERLADVGWTDFSAVRKAVTDGLAGSVQSLAGQALMVGQGAFSFLLMLSMMLYLAFFLLRDGERLAARVAASVPLEDHQCQAVFRNFTVVIRATIKGSLVVAIIQGLLGGVTFWLLGIGGALLWGVVMGALSLIPAIGTGLVWLPVAIYLLATGAYVKGLILAFCGMFVIGMVDNILRPILVGRDTRMPDYVVLFSTLGGLQLFGISGFIIGPVVAALFIGTWNIFTDTWRKPTVSLPADADEIALDKGQEAGDKGQEAG